MFTTMFKTISESIKLFTANVKSAAKNSFPAWAVKRNGGIHTKFPQPTAQPLSARARASLFNLSQTERASQDSLDSQEDQIQK